MREHRARTRLALSAAILLFTTLVVGACVPAEMGPSGSEGLSDTGGDGKGSGNDAGDDDPPPPPPVDPGFTFAISASPSDPFVSVAEPALGEYDLYLWLICANAGLFLVQTNLVIEGDTIVGEGFSPDPGVIGIDWDEYGEFIATLGDCDEGPMRLGAFHLVGEGDGVAFSLQSEDSRGRATACGASEPSPFASRGFASDGSEPAVVGAEDGCEDDANALAMNGGVR